MKYSATRLFGAYPLLEDEHESPNVLGPCCLSLLWSLSLACLNVPQEYTSIAQVVQTRQDQTRQDQTRQEETRRQEKVPILNIGQRLKWTFDRTLEKSCGGCCSWSILFLRAFVCLSCVIERLLLFSRFSPLSWTPSETPPVTSCHPLSNNSIFDFADSHNYETLLGTAWRGPQAIQI